jgi:hypothetical protein
MERDRGGDLGLGARFAEWLVYSKECEEEGTGSGV